MLEIQENARNAMNNDATNTDPTKELAIKKEAMKKDVAHRRHNAQKVQRK